jgi:hypothetical protein
VENMIENIKSGTLSVEEYADGFMIQVYQLKGESEFHITSRSKRDASGTFYSTKTFHALYLEACAATGVKIEPQEWNEPDIVKFWSFVIQHPEHRIVTPFSTPKIHLIQRGHVHCDGTVMIWNESSSLSLISSLANTVKETSLMEWIRQTCQTNSWWFRGVIVKDVSGERWRFHSEKYLAIKSLRGGESSIYERYARIFTQNLNATYFEYYPEDMLLFSLCGVFMSNIINKLYRMYMDIYIRKSYTLKNINRIYRQHLYAIHGIYLTSMRSANKWITPQHIQIYLIRQSPNRISFLIQQYQEEYHLQIA